MSLPIPAGVSGDVAGGAVTAVGQSMVSVNGIFALTVPDPVASHGENEHAGSLMVQGSAFFTINGLLTCRLGDAAACGDTLATTQTMLLIS